MSKRSERNKRQERLQQTSRRNSVSPTGATRTVSEENRSPIKWGRVCVLSALLTGVLYSALQLDWQQVYNKAYSAANRPLASIKIEGEFRFVSKQEVQEMITAKLDGSFVDLDLAGVKYALEANPWIDEVSVERIWPDSLRLKVLEHRPIARWNEDGYIVGGGQLIKTGTNQALMHLPHLSGGDSQSEELARQYFLFTGMLANSGLKVTEIRVDEKMSWQIGLDDDFVLVLGRDHIQEKLENFLYVYEAHLNEQKENIERIDMRYEKGLAVRWKNDKPELVAANAAQ